MTNRSASVMTLDEKLRYGSLALAAAAVVASGFGIHLPGLEIAGGWGTGIVFR